MQTEEIQITPKESEALVEMLADKIFIGQKFDTERVYGLKKEEAWRLYTKFYKLSEYYNESK